MSYVFVALYPESYINWSVCGGPSASRECRELFRGNFWDSENIPPQIVIDALKAGASVYVYDIDNLRLRGISVDRTRVGRDTVEGVSALWIYRPTDVAKIEGQIEQNRKKAQELFHVTDCGSPSISPQFPESSRSLERSWEEDPWCPKERW